MLIDSCAPKDPRGGIGSLVRLATTPVPRSVDGLSFFKKTSSTGLWIVLVMVTFSGCTSVSGDSWSANLWPVKKGLGPSDESTVAATDRPDHSAPRRSPIQLASWPVEIPSLWPQANTQGDSSRPSPLAPLSQGMNTLRDGSNTLKKGMQEIQTGSARVWNNTLTGGAQAWNHTKRLLTPPLLAPRPHDHQTSFWHRLFVPDSDPPLAATTRDFLSQDRPQWGRPAR